MNITLPVQRLVVAGLRLSNDVHHHVVARNNGRVGRVLQKEGAQRLLGSPVVQGSDNGHITWWHVMVAFGLAEPCTGAQWNGYLEAMHVSLVQGNDDTCCAG